MTDSTASPTAPRSRARPSRRAILAWAALAASGPAAAAAGWPSRPIRLVVPFPAGGSADLSARLLAEHLRVALGPAIVENKPGAGGNLAAADAARSEPDGHTLFVGTNGTQTINESLYKRVPYDSERDFVPIGLVWEAPHLVVAHPSLPVRTLDELAAFAAANPGKLNYGSSGIGSGTHLAGEVLGRRIGQRLTHVPYRGQAPAVTDLVAGRIELMIPLVPDILAQVQAGTVRALAVAAPARSGLLPDVPTSAEAGMPEVVATSWVGLLAPRATPPDVVTRLAAELAALSDQPGFRARLRDLGIEVRPLGGEAFAAKIATERRAAAALIADLGISIE